MTLHATAREHQRLLEVAREYQQRGYDVVIEPTPNQLPDFLASFRIDMLASSAEESVIVEVRTQESLTQAPELDRIAQAIHDKPSWRFELVVTNPKDRSSLQFKDAIPLGNLDIVYRLREARQLADQEHGEAAFLLAWSATEALLRYIANKETIPADQNNRLQIVKSLFSYGLLDKEQYHYLNEGLQVRNMIAHGYKEQRSLTSMLEKLLDVTDQLVGQHLSSL